MEQCQIMKPNSMQCSNPAFVVFNKVPYCLLHLNEQLNTEIQTKIPVAQEQFELVLPTDEDIALLKRAIEFTNAAITSVT